MSRYGMRYITFDVSDEARHIIQGFSQRESNLYHHYRGLIRSSQKIIMLSPRSRKSCEQTIDESIDALALLDLSVEIETFKLSENIRFKIEARSKEKNYDREKIEQSRTSGDEFQTEEQSTADRRQQA